MVIKTKELKDRLSTMRDLYNKQSAHAYAARVQLELESFDICDYGYVTIPRAVYDAVISNLKNSEAMSDKLLEEFNKLQ